jgi:hypothetical protein
MGNSVARALSWKVLGYSSCAAKPRTVVGNVALKKNTIKTEMKVNQNLFNNYIQSICCVLVRITRKHIINITDFI